MQDDTNHRRLLIVQTGFLGDAVLASSVVRGLHEHHPDVRIGLVVRADVADLYTDHPGLAYLHRLDKARQGGTRKLVEELRSVGYRTALLAHRSLRSAWIARRAGIGRRIGYRQGDAPWLLSDRIDYGFGCHEVVRLARLAQCAGLDYPGDRSATWLVPNAELVRELAMRFAGDGPLVLVAPGSVWPTKRWGADRFAELARALRARGAHVVLVGSGAEQELAMQVAREGGIHPDDNACGELTLPQVLALVSLAQRLYANDSAPLHLAESVGTPVTAIFGPTVTDFGFAPRGVRSAVVQHEGLPCRPCGIHGARRCPIHTHECMRAISVAQVLVAGSEEWGRAGRSIPDVSNTGTTS